jgi:hypothetical protein
MAHTQDFIPSRDADFDGWLANLTAYVDGKVTAGTWTHIPADKVTALKGLNTSWHTAYIKSLSANREEPMSLRGASADLRSDAVSET